MSDNLPAFLGDKETLPAHLQNAASNAGNENVTSSDIAIPRLKILQKLSPEIDSVEDAAEGMIINSVTEDLYDAVFVVPLLYRKAVSVFKKRALGGGYEGQFESDEEARQHLRDNDLNIGDYDISDVATHTALLLNEDGGVISPVEIMMSGTKLQVSQRWNAAIATKNVGPDGPLARFASVWRLTTVKQSNTHGSWMNFSVEWCGFAPEDLFAQAQATYEGFTATAETDDEGETEAA
jgi:hypothetical protein